jgi:hypothetical protein
VFWLALAATQWKLGRLVDSVRNRAIEMIDSGSDLRRWEDNPPSTIEQRQKHLAKLRVQLLAPQPKRRKLKPRVKSTTDFQPGDIAVFRLDDKIAVRFCVLYLWGDRGGTYTSICLLGVEDGTPFERDRLELADTMGPHFTMLSHEPLDRTFLLRRGVHVPPRGKESGRAWNHLPVDGHACRWENFPDGLRKVLPKLGWLN